MQKNISLLGSTGSIGRNVTKVVRQFPGRFHIVGLAAGKNIQLLRDQIEAFHPQLVSVATRELAAELIGMLPAGWNEKILWGQEGNIRVATLPQADTVVSSIVGGAGLMPTLAAIQAGKNIALANKETLVMAGDLVMREARRNKVELLPIDSEHNAIFQALAAGRKEDVHKIILTASGGPFREKDERNLWDVTPEEALNHPNWDMGNKISIDSATLMNKGLEVIEARWLFDIDVENIEVLVHPQSIVHSLVEYIDGSVIAQMGIPDMRIPITYALSWPERLKTGLSRLNLAQCMDLNFFPPDFNRFPALKLAYQACKKGGTFPAILNASNEIAVQAFLNRKIRFPEISLVVAETLNRLPQKSIKDISTVLDADLAARMQAESIVEALHIKFKQMTGQEIDTPELPERVNTRNLQK
ncbi:MAG: 1-deoxy-D-xylulose-5-phosphate reductoisomerase [Desulfobulbaceae bacterium]|nr:1-deoxy-D-xylulose-5-phosphate reductoisomerase [Desulfobulbaceae bacterium]